jgi:hypothetical protein
MSILDAICRMLCVICQVLYAKLHMLDCNMPNTMTIAMSFSMITEQVGHLIIHIYLLPGYDSPYCRYREEITIIPPWLQFISQILGISVCQHIRVSINILSNIYFSMPAYHGINQNLRISISPFISVCQHITTFYNPFSHRQFLLSNISRHRSQS